MTDNSKYIVSIDKKSVEKISNNSELIINNLKILIKQNEKEIHILKNNIINYELNNNNFEIKINYYNTCKNTIFIKFDDKSESAYNSLVSRVKEFNKVKGNLYYPSGNIRMEGEFTLDEDTGRYSANGNAKVYYDNSNKDLYYEGEIENEMFDGSGIFYNESNNILLTVNNIDQNNPIGKGKLTVKDISGNIYYQKEFYFDNVNEIDFSNFNLDEFIKINNIKNNIFEDLVNYNSFINEYNISKKVNNDILLCKDTSIDNKFELILKRIYELDEKMNKLILINTEIHEKATIQPKKVGFFS